MGQASRETRSNAVEMERGREGGTHVLVLAAVLEATQASAVLLGRCGRHRVEFSQRKRLQIG